MSWQDYITNLLSNDGVEDASIIGLDGSVWASCETGWLRNLSLSEVKALCGSHGDMFCNGATLAGKKCAIVRDDPDAHTLDLKMKVTDKDPDPLFITVGQSHKALVIARGKKGGTGGHVNPHVFKIVEHLRQLGF
ncbi:profilin-1 [Neoarius graeffei]|uniref:profilin-1 n=1 Tax=Neoarius graeffei TaxID=443677 RepID=UPI00298C3A4E|nr:profilin-1 [Neoarius graeffei]